MPWKFREQREEKPWHSRPIVRIALVILLCGSVAAVPYAWDRYQQWNERRRLGRAQQALLRGDLRQALLEARGVLKADPHNRMATEIIESSTAALQAPEAASWRRMLSAMESRDPDQLLGLAEAFIRAEDFTSAAQALEKVRREDQSAARFHRLAATVAAKKGDPVTAMSHWSEAIRLAPEEDDYRLQLAALHLASGKPAFQTAASKTIEEIKAKPTGRRPALRTLLEDAKRRDDRAAAREIAMELASDPEAEFLDKLALLSVLRSLRPKRDEEFSAYLEQLQKVAVTEPRNIFELISWMIDHDLALLVPDWVSHLPAEVTTVPPVAPGIAAAEVRAANWKQLKARTEAASWGDMEFLRLAFLALALDRLGDWNAATAIWSDALEAAQKRPELLERLARVTSLWGWKERTEEVLWKLAPSEWCPRWVMDTLWSAAMARGDTAKLYEVSKIRLKAEPESAISRNNHIALALLAGQSTASTFQLAEQLLKENPKSALIASTHGFALYQQGRAREAAAVLETFKPEDLRVPAVAQYYGIFLAASGQTDRAEEFLQLGSTGPQLPEEKKLVAFFTALCRTRSLESRGEAAAARVAWNETLSAADDRADRLELLARMALDWNWQTHAETALVKLAALDRCPPWAADALWGGVMKSGDANQIYRASRLIAKSKPDSVAARTNFLLLALLGRHEKDAPFPTVESHYKSHVEQPEARAAYGLALTAQGKAEEAVALMAAMPPAHAREARSALYHGFFLAAAGRADEAQAQLQTGAPTARFPEEATLAGLLQLAFDASKLERGGDSKGSDAAWNQALAAAQGRPDWLEMLAKMAVKSGPNRHAEAALWRLSAEDGCPRWAIDALWTAVLQSGNSADRYKVSKLVLKADPKSLHARSTSIILALLTGQETDAPQRQAETIYKANLSSPEAIVTYGLSLYLQDRVDEAVKLMAVLSPEQLRNPRPALYFGIFLAATEAPAKALEYLRIGASQPMLPEERALLEKVAAVDSLKTILQEQPRK